MKQPKKRLLFFLVCVVLLMTALGGKLACIQIIDRERYVAVAERQQRIALEGIDQRGAICDRWQQPLTGTEEGYLYLLKRTMLDSEARERLAVMGARQLSSKSDRYVIYSCKNYDKRNSEWLQKMKEAFILRTPQRYSNNQSAVHVLGYVSGMDGKGVCGLEKDFDDWLSQRDKMLYVIGDGANYIIPGFGIQNSTGRNCALITTLDAALQRAAENLLKEEKVIGTIVVADAATGEILVCASAPTYNPNEVTDYLNSNGQEFLNLATQGRYPPGSVFKIAVAAAALEKGVVTEDTVFHCKGYEVVNGIRIKCSTGGVMGHGRITLREAFAKSCNSAFIQMGQKTGADAILEQSKAMGLDAKTLTGISGEKSGYLPLQSEVQGAGIANLSIGQGKLLVTPMEICQMTQIIANDGESKGMELAKGIVENGKVTPLTGKESRRILSAATARLLQSFMVDTVNYGTANNLKGISAGGKTGSAESTVEGKDVVHGWFTGFLPAGEPRYVVTVFVEQGGSGRASAVPLFEKMAQELRPHL